MQGILTVKPLGAQLTLSTTFVGSVDPYLVVTTEGQNRRSRVAEGMGRTPVWNDRLVFSLDAGQTRLHFALYDKEVLTSGDFLAEGSVSLSNLSPTGQTDCWLCLSRRGMLVGRLHYQLNFEPLIEKQTVPAVASQAERICGLEDCSGAGFEAFLSTTINLDNRSASFAS